MSMTAPTAKFKVESGIQLLARLTRKRDIQNFYPVLFQNGPKHGDVTELFSNNSASCLLSDIIAEALIPIQFGGVEAGVLIFITDGNLELEMVRNYLKNKLSTRLRCTGTEVRLEEVNDLAHEALNNLYVLQIYDATQLYTTIHNLECILVKYPNISLVIFDTLTAFYWSEQGFKITKLDFYLKNLLQIIQKVTKESKVSILYTRPEYFSSSKDPIEHLEACCERPVLERLNYRIQLVTNDDGSYLVNVKTFNKLCRQLFKICDDKVEWL